MRWRQILLRGLLALLLLLPAGCNRLLHNRASEAPTPILSPQGPTGRLQEVAPPVGVQQLQTALADHTPQVRILSPKDGANLSSGPVTLRLQVRDWPLVDAGALGLGPHVVVQVDNQPPLRLTQPAGNTTTNDLQIDLPALSPGSHRVTAYAARPWGEGVKSPGAWDQIRVHRVAANPLAIPQQGTPQLIPVSPGDLAGRQPVLLDWLLLDAPLQGLRDNDGSWRLRVTVNGDSFLVDQNAPLWLKGWQNGSNSVLLELVDGRGEPLNPPFNSVVSEVVLDSAGPEPLWQRGRLDTNALNQLLGNALPTPAERLTAAEPAPNPAPEPQSQPTQPAKSQPEAPQQEKPQPVALPDPELTTELLDAETASSNPQPSSGLSPGANLPVNLEVSPEDEIEPEPLVLTPPKAPEPATTTVPAESAPLAPARATASEPVPNPVSEPMSEPVPVPARIPTSSQRIVPSTSLGGSARNQVNPDGSLFQPKPQGLLSGLRQKLGA